MQRDGPFVVKLTKAGNATALNVPKFIQMKLGLKRGDYLSVRLDGERFIVERIGMESLSRSESQALA